MYLHVICWWTWLLWPAIGFYIDTENDLFLLVHIWLEHFDVMGFVVYFGLLSTTLDAI